MSIEEAEAILNEAVIEQPSISSYTYISTEEINFAIDKLLEELIIKRKEIELLQCELNEIKNLYEKRIIQLEAGNHTKKREEYLGKLLNNRDMLLSTI